MAEIGPNTRLRVSPFYGATIREGVTAFSPYKSTLMPVSYGDPDAEYHRLLNGVALWDVAVERQVEITGPDAAHLLCVRDLTGMDVGKGKYVLMCDHRGVLINDPVVLKHGDHRFWLSIGDNNILMWARAIAAERGLNVDICEPDVSPLAVQGPKAEDVVAAIFGDWVRALKYFWFAPATLHGIPLIVQRSGYSKQGGFELYLQDGQPVGHRANGGWSPRAQTMIGFGLVRSTLHPGDRVEVVRGAYRDAATLCARPFF